MPSWSVLGAAKSSSTSDLVRSVQGDSKSTAVAYKYRLESAVVDQDLSEVTVVGLLELVLDDHDAAVSGLGLDVEPELRDRVPP